MYLDSAGTTVRFVTRMGGESGGEGGRGGTSRHRSCRGRYSRGVYSRKVYWKGGCLLQGYVIRGCTAGGVSRRVYWNGVFFVLQGGVLQGMNCS